MSRLRLAAVAVCLITFSGPATTLASTDILTPSELAAAEAERATYGLPADDASVAKALVQGVDEGQTKWGMVVTSDELKLLDMEGRLTFETKAEQDLLPYARSLPNYAGAFFDQRQNAALTVLLTSTQGADELLLRAPAERPVTVKLVRHSYAELKAAVVESRAIWARVMPDIDPISVAIDVSANRLRVEVDAGHVAFAQAHASAVAAKLGVEMTVTEGVVPTPMTCTRSFCSYPLRDGIWINSNEGYSCALGFWVRSASGDKQLVTAGHCSGKFSGSKGDWSEAAYGTIGQENTNWTYSSGGYDMMTVFAPDSQATNLIYGEALKVVAQGYPTAGISVCASLTASNTVDCGSVVDDFRSYQYCWPGGPCYTNFGAWFSGISIISGDSGAPVYHRLSTGVSMYGVISTGADFALTTAVLLNNGYSVVTS